MPSFVTYQPVTKTVKDELQQLLNQSINDHHLTGLQFAYAYADGSIQSKTAGTISFERRVPIQKQHIFRIGSTTKMYTATIIMQLVAEKKIKLGDKVGQYFQQLNSWHSITIKQLLSHHSGIPEVLGKWLYLMQATLDSDKHFISKEILAEMAEEDLDFEPGSGFAYSNTNYILLAEIATKVTGRSFKELLAQRILEPFKLKTSYLPTGESPPTDLISGRDEAFLPLGPHRMHPHKNTAWDTLAGASGAMVAPAQETAFFLQQLFGGNILARSLLTEMMAVNRSLTETPQKQMTGYGLGIAEYQVGRFTLYGHPGGIMGFESLALYEPKQKLTVVLLCNTSKNNDGLFHIMEQLLEQLLVQAE